MSKAVPSLDSIKKNVTAKKFDEALEDLSTLLHARPNDIDAIYMCAVCRRYKGEFELALELLEKAKLLSPENGRIYQEEGHTYRDSGFHNKALIAYARACRFNPALVSSWRSQAKIYNETGNRVARNQAQAQIDRLNKLAPELIAVTDLIAQGKLLKAEDTCRRYMQRATRDVEGMRLLANIGIRLGVLDDAEFLLESAVVFEPDNVQVRIDYIQVLRKRQKFALALDQAKLLLNRSKDNPQFQSLYAIECMQTGDYSMALEMFEKVLRTIPNDPITLTSRGHVLKTIGSYELAVQSYQEAIKSNAEHGEAWYSLSNLKVYAFDDHEIDNMKSQIKKTSLSHMERVHLYFALGKAFEDRKKFQDSFSYYEEGNNLKKAQSRYTAENISADFVKQKKLCIPSFFSSRMGQGYPANDPIFIVGLPRSGSTLLEQILSSHPQVDGTFELPNILSLSQQLRRRGRESKTLDHWEVMDQLSEEELETFGKNYITDTMLHRQGAQFFIDKMPNNFRHIGLIQLILPNAKIIDARRHPMACCFSGFKQLFAEGQEFSYSLSDIGAYYKDYMELMDHWDLVLPGKILRVQYEDVVSDLEGQVRRLLKYCGLPFDNRCINFHTTDRSVRTPSSEQVRRPIYDAGLDSWRPFEDFLGPLKEALGPAVARYPFD
ncbi:MAG: sulfotransferase family protein [Gammaproteobacteria bacterium TMED1]|nr:MAG: sulfotransferase family protein [Gammaproteobacteria bacterium TMED1]|tara:strand:- start:747 stop:2735 length:1989 start_codon:yes stop_codon:yes gene_type:complete